MKHTTVALLACALSCAGCFELDYLLQAGEGQLDLLCRARSIESSVENPDLDAHTRRLLADVPRIKAFASTSGLVPTDSYEDYVELPGRYVVWVVSAAPPLSLEPKRWAFPIVGSVPYLGWFDHHLARAQAEGLKAEGWDVDVRGSTAYSTLGWFDDPVLSSMIEDSPDADGELANVILHESVHATIYVPGQSEFNEGLATFVGDRLTLDYLTQRFGPSSQEIVTWEEGEVYAKKTQERLHEAYQDLKRLYATKASDEDKLARKSAYLDALRTELRFRRPITNATLAGYDTYHGGSQAFGALLVECGNDLKRLMSVAQTVKESDFPKPQASDLTPIVKKLGARCREAAKADAPKAEKKQTDAATPPAATAAP
ncbi:MAG: hypothetical protein HOW73_21065 [Polyangiaceae bacterium]|nr:hypothetical protein [Polyangiaceae bacterium]